VFAGRSLLDTPLTAKLVASVVSSAGTYTLRPPSPRKRDPEPERPCLSWRRRVADDDGRFRPRPRRTPPESAVLSIPDPYPLCAEKARGRDTRSAISNCIPLAPLCRLRQCTTRRTSGATFCSRVERRATAPHTHTITHSHTHTLTHSTHSHIVQAAPVYHAGDFRRNFLLAGGEERYRAASTWQIPLSVTAGAPRQPARHIRDPTTTSLP